MTTTDTPKDSAARLRDALDLARLMRCRCMSVAQLGERDPGCDRCRLVTMLESLARPAPPATAGGEVLFTPEEAEKALAALDAEPEPAKVIAWTDGHTAWLTPYGLSLGPCTRALVDADEIRPPPADRAPGEVGDLPAELERLADESRDANAGAAMLAAAALIRRLAARAPGEVDAFREWWRANVPGGTVISNPDWWADRIIRRLAARTAKPSVIPLPCRCADATARRLCMDKHRCSVIEATAGEPGR